MEESRQASVELVGTADHMGDEILLNDDDDDDDDDDDNDDDDI